MVILESFGGHFRSMSGPFELILRTLAGSGCQGRLWSAKIAFELSGLDRAITGP